MASQRLALGSALEMGEIIALIFIAAKSSLSCADESGWWCLLRWVLVLLFILCCSTVLL